MKNNTIPTNERNQLPKEMLVILYTNLSESFRILSEQNGMIQKQNEQRIHQTEGQLSIDLETMCIPNEAECLVE